jgi:hypothetical protein
MYKYLLLFIFINISLLSAQKQRLVDKNVPYFFRKPPFDLSTDFDIYNVWTGGSGSACLGCNITHTKLNNLVTGATISDIQPADLGVTLTTAVGGTGGTDATTGFDNLAPTTTEGDIRKKADAELDAAVRKPEKAKKDPTMVSVSQVAQELGLDPKRARARLRAAGKAANEGRWPLVKIGSAEHAQLVALLTPAPKAEPDEDDEEGDDEE